MKKTLLPLTLRKSKSKSLVQGALGVLPGPVAFHPHHPIAELHAVADERADGVDRLMLAEIERRLEAVGAEGGAGRADKEPGSTKLLFTELAPLEHLLGRPTSWPADGQGQGRLRRRPLYRWSSSSRHGRRLVRESRPDIASAESTPTEDRSNFRMTRPLMLDFPIATLL